MRRFGLIQRCANAGVTAQLDRRLARAIATINWICLTITALNLFFIVFYALTAQFSLIPSTLPTPIMSCVVLLLNRFHYYAVSRALIVSFSNLSILACVYYFGQATAMQAFFFPACAAPFLIFTNKERSFLIGFSLLPLVFYMLCSHNLAGIFDGQIVLSREAQFLIRLVCELSSLVMVTLVSLIFYVVVDSYHAEMVTEQQDKIEQTKLASLAVMAGGIAHELNNPLAIIAGRADQLSRLDLSGQNRSKVDYISSNIGQQVQRISDIVASLRVLALDRQNSAAFAVPFGTLLAKILVFFRESLSDKGITLLVDDEMPAVDVFCNEAEIMQAFVNLLENAIDAVLPAPKRWIAIKANETATHLQVQISDSGLGIAPTVRPHLMQPFFTTKAIGEGKGLGLSIAKRNVDRHGGKLWLDDSQPHTCFIMELPLAGS